VNFTEFPRVLVPVNTAAIQPNRLLVDVLLRRSAPPALLRCHQPPRRRDRQARMSSAVIRSTSVELSLHGAPPEDPTSLPARRCALREASSMQHANRHRPGSSSQSSFRVCIGQRRSVTPALGCDGVCRTCSGGCGSLKPGSMAHLSGSTTRKGVTTTDPNASRPHAFEDVDIAFRRAPARFRAARAAGAMTNAVSPGLRSWMTF
jgi:hypothetical protein